MATSLHPGEEGRSYNIITDFNYAVLGKCWDTKAKLLKCHAFMVLFSNLGVWEFKYVEAFEWHTEVPFISSGFLKNSMFSEWRDLCRGVKLESLCYRLAEDIQQDTFVSITSRMVWHTLWYISKYYVSNEWGPAPLISLKSPISYRRRKTKNDWSGFPCRRLWIFLLCRNGDCCKYLDSKSSDGENCCCNHSIVGWQPRTSRTGLAAGRWSLGEKRDLSLTW